MLTIEEIEFDDTMILNRGQFILVEVLPLFKNEIADSSEADERIGTKVVVALTGHRLEKIEVEVAEIVPCSPFNMLELATITFEDFVGKFVYDDETSKYLFRGTASQFKLQDTE